MLLTNNSSDTPTKELNLIRGLHTFAQIEPSKYFKVAGECYKYWTSHNVDPLALGVMAGGIKETIFTGGGATDMSVDSFVFCVREYLEYESGRTLRRLRIISAPQEGLSTRHVFFEAWASDVSVMSGEMSDEPGTAGNEGRYLLEEVFMVLAITHGLQIERITLPESVDLQPFYKS